MLSLEALMRYFNQANEVERIIFTVESDDAISSNRKIGAFLELCLDAKEPTRCVLIASSDNKDWAEATFASVHEILAKCRTKNGLARNPWTNLAVQIFGVAVGFIVSLWLSFKIAPNLKIENSFVIAFLFTLLVFSNIWGYLNQALLGFIAKFFPNIEFVRPAKARLHWLLQAIVGSAAFRYSCLLSWRRVLVSVQVPVWFFKCREMTLRKGEHDGKSYDQHSIKRPPSSSAQGRLC